VTRKRCGALEEEAKGCQFKVYNIQFYTIDQAKYDKKKEAVLEEMEIEASKLEKDIEDDFGEGKFSMVIQNILSMSKFHFKQSLGMKQSLGLHVHYIASLHDQNILNTVSKHVH